MIKAIVTEKHVELIQAMSYEGQLAEELLIILDRAIMDEYIKQLPSEMKKSEEEQLNIVLNKSREILADMMSAEIKEKEYLYSKEDSIYHYPCESCDLLARLVHVQNVHIQEMLNAILSDPLCVKLSR